jgi:Cu-processing system permease protein
MTRDLVEVAQLEFAAVTRAWWVRLLGAAFALLSVAAAYSAGALTQLGAPEGFARTTVALVPLALVLVPIAALLVATSGQAADPGGESFLFTQPLHRFEIVLGRWLGQTAALSAAILAGLGAGAVMIGAFAGYGGLVGFGVFASTMVLLGAVFLAIGAVISAGSTTKMAALGAGAFAWIFFVLLFDAAALAAATWTTGRTGGHILLSSVFANPADLARILALSLAGTPYVLGAAGESWIRFLGGDARAVVTVVAALCAWIAAPLGAAGWIFARRDL